MEQWGNDLLTKPQQCVNDCRLPIMEKSCVCLVVPTRCSTSDAIHKMIRTIIGFRIVVSDAEYPSLLSFIVFVTKTLVRAVIINLLFFLEPRFSLEIFIHIKCY